MPAFIRILNWERYQHYKDRHPPWIKLHREILTSQTWVGASDASRVLAIAIMVLASETGNEIPNDPAFIRRRAFLNSDPDFTELLSLNFIEIEGVPDASSPLASASGSVSLSSSVSVGIGGPGERDSATPAAAVKAVIDEWNGMAVSADLPKCRGGVTIEKQIRARLKERGWREAFTASLAFYAASEFHRGKNDRGWKADLEYACRPGNAEKNAERKPEVARRHMTPQQAREAAGHNIPRDEASFLRED